jgi:anti-sigma B factor antagonist
MSLVIQVREKEGVLILDLRGRLTVGEEATLLRDKVKELATAGTTKAVLNLKGVEFIDSTGLGSLVICFTSMQKAGGTLKLLNLSQRSIELLVLTKLTTVFEVFDDEQDAVNSFYPGRDIKRFDILSFVQKRDKD